MSLSEVFARTFFACLTALSIEASSESWSGVESNASGTIGFLATKPLWSAAIVPNSIESSVADVVGTANRLSPSTGTEINSTELALAKRSEAFSSKAKIHVHYLLYLRVILHLFESLGRKAHSRHLISQQSLAAEMRCCHLLRSGMP